MVEIYTRAMLRHAGGRGLKLRDPAALAARSARTAERGSIGERKAVGQPHRRTPLLALVEHQQAERQ